MPLGLGWGMSTLATLTHRDYVLGPIAAFSVARRLRAARPWRRALLALTGSTQAELGSVSSFEPGCVVADDPGEVVRSAKPISAHDRDRMREQHISRMMAEYRRQRSEPLTAAVALH